MRTIKVSEFKGFRIAFSGVSITLFNFDAALKEWNGLNRVATFYGIKYDGSEAILDTK